jgi:transposase
MMGRQSVPQPKLFYTGFNLEKRIRKDHILRKIPKLIDFDFIYNEVEDHYGVNGNVSVPPPIILKMLLLLLLMLYNVRSERELMQTIPERLDWLWFLRCDLDDEIPNHSVLSKARKRWGVETFKRFFDRIVSQCVEAGLVDGTKLFTDASLIDADASNNSVVDTHSLKRYFNESYKRFEKRLDDLEIRKDTPVNSRFISITDPDASVVRQGGGRAKVRYKTHRCVDPKYEIITATKITHGSCDEGDLLKEMIGLHENNTNVMPRLVVGDSKYGKIENYLLCYDANIKAHIPSIERSHRSREQRKGIFSKEAFHYDSVTDTFRCPAGQTLKGRRYSKERNNYEYKAPPKVCMNCQLREKCTRSKNGRTVHRHLRQDELDKMLKIAESRSAKKDIKARQHISERSFAWSKRYGYKRARWRGYGKCKYRIF